MLKRGTGQNQNLNRALLTSIQMGIEEIKVPIYIALALEYLKIVKNGKIAIMVNYLTSLDKLCKSLVNYNPVRIEGKMKPVDRQASMDAFQAPNLDCRVIVATLQTGGEGIDLDDKSGKYPRCILIPPCYKSKIMVQASGRVYRDGTKSAPKIMIIYTAGRFGEKDLEKRFYESVRRKTETIKKFHAAGQQDKLPCDYRVYTTSKVYKTSIDVSIKLK